MKIGREIQISSPIFDSLFITGRNDLPSSSHQYET